MALIQTATVLVVLRSAAASSAKCGVPKPSFCSGVDWNSTLPLAPETLDAAAKSDFEIALDRLHHLGGEASMPLCLESWKALQCASKFERCAIGTFRPKVCRSLCVQFANNCNGSASVHARCADNLLYDEPPCTDYADFITRGSSRALDPWMTASEMARPSPTELFNTAAGLPLIITLAVLLLHASCCALQYACGAGSGDEEGLKHDDDMRPGDHVRNAVEPLSDARASKSPLLESPVS